MFLIGDKRQRLVELIRFLLKEDLKLGKHWETWVQSEDVLSQVDREIIHLILHFMKDGRLIFKQGQQTKEAKELLEILVKYKDDIEQAKKECDGGGHKGFYMDNTYRAARELLQRIDIVLSSVKEDDKKIKKLIGMEFGISKGKLWEVKDGNFIVEYHPDVEKVEYGTSWEDFIGVGNGSYLLIYDNGYLIAAVLGKFSRDRFNVTYTMETYIGGMGYMRRAIKLLLLFGQIKYWLSTDDEESAKSGQVRRMYESFEEDSRFALEHIRSHDLYVVRLESTEPLFK